MIQTLHLIAAQINPVVGAIEDNAIKIITAIKQAKTAQADLIVFPEMALVGYPPEDLLLRPELYQRTKLALKQIQTQTKNIHVILGLPLREKNQNYNSALLLFNGKILATYHKQILPNYGVFDEQRYFTAGTKTCICKIKGVPIAITICEDLWGNEPMRKARQAGAKLMLSINASPFDRNKSNLREKIIKTRARANKMPIVYVNTVGGQDELVFDGGSMVVNAHGTITQRAEFFTETLMPININISKNIAPLPKPLATLPSTEAQIYNALVLGVRDYINKNNFKGAIVSVSGGIDSALTLAIANDAIGKERIETAYLPSRYSSELSQQIVTEQAKLLDIKLTTISIEPIFQQFLKNLPKEFAQLPKDATEENIQARCRGTLIMAFSNKKGLIVLSTGNRSENAVGYATLYGDMVGGFCVLKDVPKTLVFRLAKYRNQLSKVIPDAAITRAPSAELAPNQKDSDSLPPYPILDEILERYIEREQSQQEIIAAGFAAKTVAKVIRLVNNNEYKRRQAPPGIKITTRAFGRERRYPITSGF